MSTPRYFFAATSFPDGRMLVEGGCNKGDCGTVTKSAEVFDSRTHTWTVTGSLATGRDYHTDTLLANGKVLVAVALPFRARATVSSSMIRQRLHGRPGLGRFLPVPWHSASALPDGRAVVAALNVSAEGRQGSSHREDRNLAGVFPT